MATNNNIILGSGKLYIAKFTAGTDFDLATVAVEANQVGLIQGGATLEYKPSTYEVKDDLCVVYKRFITSEEATLKSGILTWDLAALDKIVGNKNYTTTAAKRTLKLGGNGAREMEQFAVVFVHTKTDGCAIRVGVIGTNEAGLSLSFAADKETVVDAEFRAIGSDENGTLVIIEEDLPNA